MTATAVPQTPQITFPKKTAVEQWFEACVASNRTAIGINGTAAVVTSGPLRVNSTDPEAAKTLAATALAGSASKEVVFPTTLSTIPSPPVNRVATLTAAIKATAVIIRYCGPREAWYRQAYIFTIAGTGMTTTKVSIQPDGEGPAIAFVLLTTDNGGVGQISAPSGITVTWAAADNNVVVDATAQAIADKFTFSVEPVTLRDFASGLRSQQ